MFRIGIDALDRADGHAFRLVEMADALGAARRVDHVDEVALAARLVRAAGLADIAIEAGFGDLQRHSGWGSGRRGRRQPGARWGNWLTCWCRRTRRSRRRVPPPP